MKMFNSILIILIMFLCTSISRSQSPEWIVINNDDFNIDNVGSENYFDHIKALSDSSVWVSGPGNGIYIYKNGLWKNLYEFWHSVDQHFWITGFTNIVENFQNSTWLIDDKLIKINQSDTIMLDDSISYYGEDMLSNGNYLWIVTGDSTGLMRFDGTNATYFQCLLPEIDSNFRIGFYNIRKDNQGNFWLGSAYGLFKYNGIEFTRYHSNNTNLPGKRVIATEIDKDNKIWITLADPDDMKAEVCRFDGTNFTIYNSSNSILPNDTVISWAGCIAVDSSNNKWIGTVRGLFKFDGTNWTKFDISNSNLPNNIINGLTIDKLGNLWIATSNGLAVFKEGGVNLPTSVNDEKKDIPSFSVFPNPSENTIKIKYTNVMSGQVKITLTDINGNTKMEQVRASELSDEQTDTIDTSSLEAGTYFVKVQAGKVSAVNKVVIVK